MTDRTIQFLAASLLLGGGTFAATASGQDAPAVEPSPKPTTRYVVAAVGDSITDARSGGRYIEYLRKRCPESRFDNYGKGAEMVNQMRRRFARDVLGPSKPKYTHVIVFGGVNDLYSDLTAKRTPAKIEKDLTQMYEMSKERGIEVIAITVAPWGGFSRYYNARRGGTTLEVNRWIGQQQQEGKIDHVVNAYSLLSCGDPEKLCPAFVPPFNDGLHFNAKGHNKLGEALYKDVFADCR
jgi:lysophospholipase L1-like esterase